ncbi:ferredoxin [Chakrabartyella piscis]|uniref:ferredoxin n=1 Tax=Chakrabartyella piscis TaxID=2918914 RepID=UPI0029589D96|nr:ferredoxin [Chakrabartyella piscis]
MTVTVSDACIGCRFCMNLCSDVFAELPNGKAYAIGGEIPADAKEMVLEAKTNCPAVAISTMGE